MMTDVKSNKATNVTQSFYYYESSEGDNVVSQASGAYIFRPKTNEATPLCADKLLSYEVRKVLHACCFMKSKI